MQFENLQQKIKSNFPILIISIVIVLVHLYTNLFASYGIFRDEYYYLACANRLDFGYVDQPPFSIYILKIITILFGSSLFAIRLLPALVSGYIVFITGILTKKLGGGQKAIMTAGLITGIAPILLAFNTIYSMNCIGLALWVTAFYIVQLILTQSKTRYWICLGIVMGVGLLNKIDFLWFGAGLFFGLLFTENRKYFKTKLPYLAAGIAFLIFSPYIIWNITHDYAHLEFMSNAVKYKYGALNQIQFILDVFQFMNPLTIFIWIPGILFFFLNKDAKRFRMQGIIFLTVALILLINGKSKAEYIASSFFPVLAAGAVVLERFGQRNKLNWLTNTYILLITLSGVLISPIIFPILPAETYIAYTSSIGIKPASNENKKLSEMPQFFADMFGWEDLAKNVSNVYNNLPDSLKNKTVIAAGNYGEAGSLEYYSKKYNLPAVACSHNNYWIWGQKELADNYEVFIVIGGKKENHLKSCEEVYLAGTHITKYAMPYENNLPIYICKKLKLPIKSIIEKEKKFI